MRDFNANRDNTLIKVLIWVLCIAVIVVIVAVYFEVISIGPSAPTESINGTEVGATESTGATEATEPSSTENTEATEPDSTEAMETEGSAPTDGEMDSTNPSEDTTPTVSPHSHSYSSTVTKDATCTETGVKTYTCTCGDSYTKGTSALGHKYEKTVVQPTNSTQGYTQHTCTRCDHSYKDDYTDPLIDPNHVHSYVANVVAPNCYKKGYTIYTCPCGRTYKDMDSITQPLGHTWGEWNDCGDGSSTRDCLTCGRKDFKVNEDCSTGYYNKDTDYEAVGGGKQLDPNGDPNGDPADYVAPANPKTGISWDGVSPIIYTYANGSTGAEPKIGATYYITPYRIATVTVYTLGWASPEEYLGGASDGYCGHCGMKYGDGTKGTCIRWLAGGTHVCDHCGETVPDHTCHTCPEN